jgi:hypothetical protein
MKLDFTNSTRPELLKLDETFPNVESLRGTIIKWADLESAIGLARHTNRFRTVLASWRKHLKKDKGIWTRGDTTDVIGLGIRVLTHEEQIEFSGRRYRQAGRRIIDGHAAAASTDDSQLSEEAKREKEHRILAGRHLHAAVLESRRFLPKATEPPETNPAKK